MLACCIYGHFLSSLNRAGCAGNLRSPLQMVCIMFKPPCHHPSLSSLSLSLPLSSFLYKSSKSQTLCVRKKRHPFAFSLLKGIRKSYKMLLGSLSTSITPPLLLPPSISILRPASRHLSVSWSRCSHIWLGRLPFARTDVAPVKHHIRGAGGLRRQIISVEEFFIANPRVCESC